MLTSSMLYLDIRATAKSPGGGASKKQSLPRIYSDGYMDINFVGYCSKPASLSRHHEEQPGGLVYGVLLGAPNQWSLAQS